MTFTIKYEGIRTHPIKQPAWSKKQKDDIFVKFVVTNYMLSIPSKVVNWSAKIKVIFDYDPNTKIIYAVSEILDFDDGLALKEDM